MFTNDFKAMTLKEQATVIKALRLIHQETRVATKAAKADALLQKQQAKALKQEQAIVRAQLRLQKLLEKQAKPVGAKAAKANRRPGKVTTYGAEANAIASAIMAKKASV
jgi:hypothetical protein